MSCWPNNSFPSMILLMDMEEVDLEMQKEVTRRMQELARDDYDAYVSKVREYTMLMTMNQNMLAEEILKEKFVDEFMVFLGAIDNGDLQTLRRFDEKEMMNTILKMKNSDAGDDGGLEPFYGDEVSKIGFEPVGLEEKPVIVTMVKNNGSFVGSQGEFSGGYELEAEGGMVDTVEKPNSDRNGMQAEAPVTVAAAPNETASSSDS